MLGLREIMLVVRAKDLASRTLLGVAASTDRLGSSGEVLGHRMQAIGQGMFVAGAAITAIGAGGVSFFLHATDTAASYEQQVRQTKTQVDGLGISTKFLGDLGLQVGKMYPVAFEEIQATLYDLFSSIDVNKREAVNAIHTIAAASTAGNASMQATGRATISVLNAYGMKVENIGHVSDVMFQLVKKGVGTFDQFTAVIGRVTPAGIAAGQTFESVAGMLAFLTRNGLSAAMASTSAGRAMELIAKPDVTAKLEALGVKVKDAHGNFRQMNDIITQLAVNKGWAQMTKPELKKAFQETFGTGTIQARRFFDTAIPNFMQLNKLTGDMSNAQGATLKAYAVMFDSPQNKVKLLQNRIHALTIEIGQKLLPLKAKLLAIGEKVLSWWNNLSPAVQKAVIWTGLFITALALVVGPILIVGGLLLTLVGGLVALGVGVTTAVLIIAAIPIAIAAVIAAIGLLIFNWDEVSQATEEAWQTIEDAIGPTIQNIIDWFGQLWDALSSFDINRFVTLLIDGLNEGLSTILNFFADLPGLILGALPDTIGWLVNKGKEILQGMQNGIIDLWNNVIFPWLKNLPEELKHAVGSLTTTLVDAGKHLLEGLKNGSEQVWPSIEHWYNNLGPQILNDIHDAQWWFHKMMEVGKAIIFGIMEGAKNALPSLLGYIKKSITDEILQHLKNPFDFGSPSKVTRDEIGVPLIQGILVGMQKAWPSVMDNLDSHVKTMAGISPNVNANFSSGYNSSVPSGGYGGSSVTIAAGAVQIVVGSDVSDDTIDKIRTVVEDTLTEIAVGVESR